MDEKSTQRRIVTGYVSKETAWHIGLFGMTKVERKRVKRHEKHGQRVEKGERTRGRLQEGAGSAEVKVKMRGEGDDKGTPQVSLLVSQASSEREEEGEAREFPEGPGGAPGFTSHAHPAQAPGGGKSQHYFLRNKFACPTAPSREISFDKFCAPQSNQGYVKHCNALQHTVTHTDNTLYGCILRVMMHHHAQVGAPVFSRAC